MIFLDNLFLSLSLSFFFFTKPHYLFLQNQKKEDEKRLLHTAEKNSELTKNKESL